MSNSTTPEMDKWQDLHARACKAEHEVMMQELGFLSAGTAPPAAHQIESAKMLRIIASTQFEKAMEEVLGLPETRARDAASTRRRQLPDALKSDRFHSTRPCRHLLSARSTFLRLLP